MGRDPSLVVARLSLVRHALLSALRAYRRLFLIVAPIFVVVTILRHTPVLPWIADQGATQRHAVSAEPTRCTAPSIG